VKNCAAIFCPDRRLSVSSPLYRLRVLFARFCDDWPSHDFRRPIYNDDHIKVDPYHHISRAARIAPLICCDTLMAITSTKVDLILSRDRA
jgi:hypothetical protein